MLTLEQQDERWGQLLRLERALESWRSLSGAELKAWYDNLTKQEYRALEWYFGYELTHIELHIGWHDLLEVLRAPFRLLFKQEHHNAD